MLGGGGGGRPLRDDTKKGCVADCDHLCSASLVQFQAPRAVAR